MKNVVYFLGAGFSAPAGLPVISNFLFKAKNQWAGNKQRYASFEDVFKYIDALSVAKNYVSVDLFNIEEIYSIAETHLLLQKSKRADLEQFIKKVIEHHTPPFERQKEPYTSNAPDDVLFGGKTVAPYVRFCCALGNLELNLDLLYRGVQQREIYLANYVIKPIEEPKARYKIVSLNYDLLIEKSIQYLKPTKDSQFELPIAKLHGSIDGQIVPPSWRKDINQGITEHWTNAARWIKEANEIRILGYSLPATDVYIKYLFSTALSEARNIQKIDAICLDPEGNVRSRYENLFDFPEFSFYNVDLSGYLNELGNAQGRAPKEKSFRFTEENHERFIKNVSKWD